MKKLINKTENIVTEMLEGIAAANPGKLVKVENYNIIARKEKKKKTGVISGGGSGHEPAFLGYLGDGLLDAVAVGEVSRLHKPAGYPAQGGQGRPRRKGRLSPGVAEEAPDDHGTEGSRNCSA